MAKTPGVSWRVHVDARFDAEQRAVSAALAAQEKAVGAALDAAERAVAKAEAAAEKRFEGVNEFRAALGDQQRLLMPRSEAEQLFSNQGEKIASLEARVRARDDQKRGASDNWALIVSIVAAVAALTSVFIAVTKIQ